MIDLPLIHHIKAQPSQDLDFYTAKCRLDIAIAHGDALASSTVHLISNLHKFSHYHGFPGAVSLETIAIPRYHISTYSPNIVEQFVSKT